MKKSSPIKTPKRLIISRLRQFKEVLSFLVRLSSLWLLACFSILYFSDTVAGATHTLLIWAALAFSFSVALSLLLYFWDQKNEASK